MAGLGFFFKDFYNKSVAFTFLFFGLSIAVVFLKGFVLINNLLLECYWESHSLLTCS